MDLLTPELRRTGMVLQPVSLEAARALITPFHEKGPDELQVFFQNLDNACAPHDAAPGATPDEFSIEAGYSWEVFNERVQRVAADYEKLDGDVIAFAEIDEGFYNALKLFPPFAGMNGEFFDTGSPRSLAVFSKLPIDSVAPLSPSTPRGIETEKRRQPAAVFRLRLPTPDADLEAGLAPRQFALIVDHLPGRGQTGTVKQNSAHQARLDAGEAEARTMEQMVEEERMEGVLSFGDKNAEPDSEEIVDARGFHATTDRAEAIRDGRPFVTLGDLRRAVGEETIWGTRFRPDPSQPDQAIVPHTMLDDRGVGGSLSLVPYSTLVMGLGTEPRPYLAHFDPDLGQHQLDRTEGSGPDHLIKTVRLAGVLPRESIDWDAMDPNVS